MIVILFLLFEEAYVAIFFVYISQKILKFLNGCILPLTPDSHKQWG